MDENQLEFLNKILIEIKYFSSDEYFEFYIKPSTILKKIYYNLKTSEIL